mgnify:CR=1 FL=1
MDQQALASFKKNSDFRTCSLFCGSYCSEEFFGIADITGAYVAGIILCNINDAGYIERKMDISSYMIFGPIFFASIGLQTSFDNF